MHATESELLIERVFFFVWKSLADVGAERVGALADVPWAKGEAVFGWSTHRVAIEAGVRCGCYASSCDL